MLDDERKEEKNKNSHNFLFCFCFKKQLRNRKLKYIINESKNKTKNRLECNVPKLFSLFQTQCYLLNNTNRQIGLFF